MKPVTVLMYHAIVPGQAVGADSHYSVSPTRFSDQLRLIGEHGHRIASVWQLLRAGETGVTSSRHPVCLTFDDGHLSNAHAAALIAAHGGSAEFFINPSMVGKPGFLDWPALREMADMGMSIQSHGFHHRYLDELSAQDVRSELADSKATIEDAIGKPVSIYAPAGGRMPADFMTTARSLGYEAVCSSRTGVWNFQPSPSMIHQPEIPRMAMLAGTTDRQFIDWITQAPLALLKQQLRHRVLRLSKQLLGNGGHERLRGLILRSNISATTRGNSSTMTGDALSERAQTQPTSDESAR